MVLQKLIENRSTILDCDVIQQKLSVLYFMGYYITMSSEITNTHTHAEQPLKMWFPDSRG